MRSADGGKEAYEVMDDRVVTVFGGTGYLGRRVVSHLLSAGLSVRVASRHPDHVEAPSNRPQRQSVFADIHDDASVASALQGSYAAVNAVSLYLERGAETFDAVHVVGAGRVARLARTAGVQRLAHVSGIGANPRSGSRYIRSRGKGEIAVKADFPSAVLVRPAVMFSVDDAFLNTIVRLLTWLPAYPMFGRGETRLQPAYVEDVAEAIVRALVDEEPVATYELGGPRIYTYEELLRTVEHGVVFSPMHSWRGQLTDEEMQDVVAYIRLLSQQGHEKSVRNLTRASYP